jgi:hypothetical protein
MARSSSTTSTRGRSWAEADIGGANSSGERARGARGTTSAFASTGAFAAASALLVGAALLAPAPALAQAGKLSPEAKEGLALAKDGDCVAAVPKLEKAEVARHRPLTARALGACHVALGELLLAYEILSALAAEMPEASWTKDDKKAHSQAKSEALAVDLRIPRVVVRVEPAVEATVVVAGAERDPTNPIRVAPDEKTEIAVSAPGFLTETVTVLLAESDEREVVVTLRPASAKGPVPPKAAPAPARDVEHWLGFGVRGIVMPQFLVGAAGEGGRTFFFPGGEVRYSARLASVDVEPSLAIMSYGTGTFPFKSSGTPDTEWELVESDLLAMNLALDVLYRVPLTDSGSVEFRIGAGFGIGWAFFGEVYRWQSYPEDLQPGDPADYKKCKAPNDPPGSFRYCNQLDKDADRYGAAEPWWGDGGVRPTVYPWISLPQLGFAFRPAESTILDVQVGLTPIGLFSQLGARFAL